MSGYDYYEWSNGVQVAPGYQEFNDSDNQDVFDLFYGIYTDSVFTTWSDDMAAGSPSELEQYVMDNYSDSTLAIQILVTERSGVMMDEAESDPVAVATIKDALFGGFCLTEATEEGDWDGVTALTEDDDGVTICAVAGGDEDW